MEEIVATLKKETENIRKNFSYPDIKIDSSLHYISYQGLLEDYSIFNSWINMELRFVNLDLLEERIHDNGRFVRAIEDLRDTGTIYPITLDFNEENNSYQVVNGHHRISACKLFGYRMIPAVVHFICFYNPNNGFQASFRMFDDPILISENDSENDSGYESSHD